MQFPDCNIAVLNDGPIMPELWYDGKVRVFRVGEATIIPSIEAYFHFGVEVRDGKLVREKYDTLPNGTQTQYAARVASMSPYGLVHGKPEDRNKEKFNELRDWFKDGLRFKLVRTQKQLSKEEFERIK